MEGNAFLALAQQSGELGKDSNSAGRSRPRAPDEILREAREKHTKYKAFVASGHKAGPRHVAMSRIQFGEGEFEWGLHDLQRLQESLQPPGPLQEMETPVPLTRTLLRTRSLRMQQTRQEAGAAAAAGSLHEGHEPSSWGNDEEESEKAHVEQDLPQMAVAAPPAALQMLVPPPATALRSAALLTFRYRGVLRSVTDASLLGMSSEPDPRPSADGAGCSVGDNAVFTGLVIPTPPPPSRPCGHVLRQESSHISLDGRPGSASRVAQLRGFHSFTRRPPQGGTTGFTGTDGHVGAGQGSSRSLREMMRRTAGMEDGPAPPAIRSPDSPFLGHVGQSPGSIGPYSQRTLLSGSSCKKMGVGTSIGVVSCSVSCRALGGPSHTAPQLMLDLSSLDCGTGSAKALSPPAAGQERTGGSPAAECFNTYAGAGTAATAATVLGPQGCWTAGARPVAGSEACSSSQSPTAAAAATTTTVFGGRAMGSPTSSQVHTRMAFPGLRGSLAREEFQIQDQSQPVEGVPPPPLQQQQQQLVPRASGQEEACGSSTAPALLRPAPLTQPQPQPPLQQQSLSAPGGTRIMPCPPVTPTVMVVAAGSLPSAPALTLAPSAGLPRNSCEVSSEQLTRNAVLAGWSSRRRSERNLFQHAGGGGGGGGGICEGPGPRQPQSQPHSPQQQQQQHQQVAGRSQLGRAGQSGASAVIGGLRAECFVGWAAGGTGSPGSNPGSGSDVGSFRMSREADEDTIPIGSHGAALRRQQFGLPPGMSAAAGVCSLRTNSASNITLPGL